MEEKIKEIMCEIFDINEDAVVVDDLRSGDSSSWDSLNHLKLITALEEEFDVKMTMGEIKSMNSFSKIKETIKQHI